MRSVTKVSPLPGHRLSVEFDNGEKRISDVSYLLEKPVFSFLKDPRCFASVYIECGAVTWKDLDGNEVDICPDKLYTEGLPGQ